MRGNRLLMWGASRQWAILPETLHNMVDYATRERLQPEELHTILENARNTEARLEVANATNKGQILNGTENVVVRNGIALIQMIGPIFRYGDNFSAMSGALTLDQLQNDYNVALNDLSVKSIIFVIDSPGGEAAGIGDFAAHIASSKNKPVKAFAAYQCCSAAYWIASATDEIVASSTATVGSIGAIMQVANPDNIKNSEPLRFVSAKSKKKMPDLKTEEGKQVIQDRVDALGNVFMEEVAQLRGMKLQQIEDTEGAAFVGRNAKDCGLVDSIGTLETLIASMTPKMNGGTMANRSVFAMLADTFRAVAEEETETIPVVASANIEVDTMSDADKTELIQLREEREKLQSEKLQLMATAFAKDAITSGKALPAEMTDLVETFLDAARDDAKYGPIALANGVNVTRVSRISDRTSRRIPHTLTTPITASGGTDKVVVLANLTESVKDTNNIPLTQRPERRAELLSMTAEGRQVLATEAANKK